MPRKKITETLLSDTLNTTQETAPSTSPAEPVAPKAAKPAAKRKKAEVLPSEEEPAASVAPTAKAGRKPKTLAEEAEAAEAAPAPAKPARGRKKAEPALTDPALVSGPTLAEAAKTEVKTRGKRTVKAAAGQPEPVQKEAAPAAKAPAKKPAKAKAPAAPKAVKKQAPVAQAEKQAVEAKAADSETPAAEPIDVPVTQLRAGFRVPKNRQTAQAKAEAEPEAVPAPKPARAEPEPRGRRDRSQGQDGRERNNRGSRQEKRGPGRQAPEQPAEPIILSEAQIEALDANATLTFSFRAKEVKKAFDPGKSVSEAEIIASLASSQDVALDDIPPLVTEIIVGAWRTIEGEIVEVPAAPSVSEALDEVPGLNFRSRRRKDRRRDRRDRPGQAGLEDELDLDVESAGDETADEAVVVAAQPAKPVKKERVRIPIPVDAPQVVLHHGIPTLVADKKILPPLFLYLGGSQANPSQQDEQVKTAAESGVNSVAFPIHLEVSDEGLETAVYMAKQRMEAILAANPEAVFVGQVCFTFPIGWEQDSPAARWRTPSGRESRPSFCDDELWGQAERALADLVKNLQASTYGPKFLGVHLDRHSWHYLDEDGYDDSPAARKKFGLWLRHRYGNDVVSLRASWFDGKVGFDDVYIPNYAKRHGAENDFVRLDRRARRWVDYNLFLSDTLVDRIASMAYAAKSAGEGKILVGVSYGYTFEWSHPASGHLSLGKLLRCNEVDYISGPSSYQTRQPGGSAAFPWPIDSFVLNGKLAVLEEDFRTPIGRSDEDEKLPLMKTPQALEAAHWRGAGAALAHGGGLNWMDMRGQGWLNSRGIWERGAKVLQALNWRISTPMVDPDVALLIDERSLAYLADPRAFEELVQDVRETLLRSGMSVGFYLLSDLAHRENFPDSRLFIFVNAWDIRPEVRSSIKARLQKEHKVLFWLYSAGLFEGGRESLERAREVTGIALRPQPFNSKPGTNLVNLRDPLCRTLPNDMMAEGGTLEPSYFAIPEDASVLGEYSQTGLPSFVVRRFPSPNTNDEPWTSVFLGEPVVTPGLFRALGQMAGCHIYSLDDDVIHVRAPFLSLHCSGAGVRTITLPDKQVCYDLIQRVWMPVENNTLKFLGLDGSTYSFLIGHKADIEAILSSTPDTLVTEAEILAHQDNTIQWDAIRFDVPIMKLDEWVEEAWGEDLADDLLIKPSMIEEVGEEAVSETEREAPRSSGQRRKRKRSKGRQDPGQQAQEQAQTVNFLFRKRE